MPIAFTTSETARCSPRAERVADDHVEPTLFQPRLALEVGITALLRLVRATARRLCVWLTREAMLRNGKVTELRRFDRHFRVCSAPGRIDDASHGCVVPQLRQHRCSAPLDIVSSPVVRTRDQVGQHVGSTDVGVAAHLEPGEATVRIRPDSDAIELCDAMDVGHGLLQSTNFRAEFFVGADHSIGLFVETMYPSNTFGQFAESGQPG